MAFKIDTLKLVCSSHEIDLQSRIDVEKHQFSQKLTRAQRDYEEKINALIDHTAGGATELFVGPDDESVDDSHADSFTPRKSGDYRSTLSPFKAAAMDNLDIEQYRTMLTLSNERTSFLKKQVERLQVRPSFIHHLTVSDFRDARGIWRNAIASWMILKLLVVNCN